MSRIIDKNKYFSSTQLKNNTKLVLEATDDLGEVFIMNNNTPRAVIITIQQYNSFVEKEDNFRITGDVIPMSTEDEKDILEGKERYKKGEYITEEELFEGLIA